MKLLFVCTGNTCRSPFAAAVAARAAREDGWEVASAGLRVSPGDRAPREAMAAAAERGLDLSEHQAQLLAQTLVDWADVVVPVTAWHAAALRQRYGAAKIRLLSATDLEDPIGRGPETYRRIYGEIEMAVERLVEELRRERDTPASPPWVGKEIHPPPAASVPPKA